METNGTKNGSQNGEVSYPSSDENGVEENHDNHLDHDHVNDFEEDHEEIFAQDQDVELTLFDETIGCIEDIVIEKQFQDLQVSTKVCQINVTHSLDWPTYMSLWM